MESSEKISKKQPTPSPLRQEREQRGWSRSYVAEQLEVDIMTVGRWERSERLPHPDHLQKLCDLFQKNAKELGLLQEVFRTSHEQEAAPASLPQISSEDDNAEGIYSQWHRHRRTFLIGLAGLCTIALAGGIWKIRQKQTSPEVATTTHILKKRPRQLVDPRIHSWINQLAFSPDGSMLAAASGSNAVILWDIQKDVVLQYYPILNQWVNDVSWSQANLLATANGGLSGGSVEVWRYPENKPLFSLQREYSMRAVAWSPQKEYLALADHSATIEIWNPITARLISHYTYTDQITPGVNRVKWSFDARYIAVADDSGTIYIWETIIGKPITTYYGHQGRVMDIAWCPGKYLIASASTDKTVQVWDALSSQTIVTYRGHNDEVHSIDWSPDKKYLASGSYDTTVQVWQALTGRHIDTYTEGSSKILTTCWSTKGDLIALGSQTQGITVLQVT